MASTFVEAFKAPPSVDPTSKIVRRATYLEPPLAVLVDRASKMEGVTAAAWLRKAVIQQLMKNNMLTQDALLKMVGA